MTLINEALTKATITITRIQWVQNFWLMSFFVHMTSFMRKQYPNAVMGAWYSNTMIYDWCEIHTLIQQSDWWDRDTNLYAAIWWVRDTYPMTKIGYIPYAQMLWLVQDTQMLWYMLVWDTYLNTAIWLVIKIQTLMQRSDGCEIHILMQRSDKCE